MYMYGHFAYMYVCAPYACLIHQQRPEAIKSPGLRDRDNGEQPSVCCAEKQAWALLSAPDH